jgi:hypothetical protein
MKNTLRSLDSTAILVVILGVGVLLSTRLEAGQINFDKRLLPTSVEYHYSFSTPGGQVHQLNFQLDRNLTETSKGLFTKSGKQQLNRRASQQAEDIYNSLQAVYIERARDEFNAYIEKQVRLLPDGIKIQNQGKGENIRASSDGSMPQEQANQVIDHFFATMNSKWQELNTQYLAEFDQEVTRQTQKNYIDIYGQHYYVASFTNSSAKDFSLRVDFDRVARLQVLALKPVADAIARNTHGLPMRKVLNYAAYYIQSIPYDTLNSRSAHDSTGFVAPLTLFDINRGDCDTKATALAAIIRNLYPQLEIKMILIPNHAFLALQIPGEEGDSSIIYAKREFVLLEAAGPSLTPVGKSYESSLEHMQANPEKIGRMLPMLADSTG